MRCFDLRLLAVLTLGQQARIGEPLQERAGFGRQRVPKRGTAAWLDAAQEFLIGKQQLEQDLRDWETAPEKDKVGALLTGLKLNRARGWLDEYPAQLTAQERAFIETSIDAENQRRETARKLAIANESRALAALSHAASLQGHYTDAVKLALAAWPRSAADPRPQLSRTIDALAEALTGPLEVSPPVQHEGPVRSATLAEEGPQGQKHVWKLAELKSKYLYVLHTLMNEFRIRFPGAGGLWRVDVAEGDVKPILDMVRDRAESSRAAE